MNFDRAYEEWFWSSPVKIWASFAQDDVPESPQLDKILQVPPDQIPEKLASAASHYYGRELLRIRALDKRLSDHVGHSRDENINWSFCGN